MISTCRQALASYRLHHFSEAIEFSECCVNIRSDANTLKLFMNDRSRKDVMLTKEVTSNIGGFDAFYIYIRNRARLCRIKRSVEADLGHILQSIHPVARQVSQ